MRLPIWLMYATENIKMLSEHAIGPKRIFTFSNHCALGAVGAVGLVLFLKPPHIHHHIMAKNVKTSIIHFAYHSKYVYSFARISKYSSVRTNKKVALPFLHNQIYSLRFFSPSCSAYLSIHLTHTYFWYNDFNAISVFALWTKSCQIVSGHLCLIYLIMKNAFLITKIHTFFKMKTSFHYVRYHNQGLNKDWACNENTVFDFTYPHHSR